MLHGPSGPFPSSEFEHSSIAATVKKIFNLKEFLTKRDAWAGTLDVILTRTSPRTDCPGEHNFKVNIYVSQFQYRLDHMPILVLYIFDELLLDIYIYMGEFLF